MQYPSEDNVGVACQDMKLQPSRAKAGIGQWTTVYSYGNDGTTELVSSGVFQ